MITRNFDDFKNNKSLIASIESNLRELKKNFTFLKSLAEQEGSHENFNSAIDSFYWIFDFIPLPAPLLDSYDMPFFRARPNDQKNVLFQHKTDISYNSTNAKVINEGRFNQREEAVFYASLPVDDSDINSSFAACLETCKGLTADRYPVTLKDFTVGRWKIVKPFYVVNFCFDEEHLKVNLQLRKQVDEYLQFIKGCLNFEASNFILEFLTYFSTLSSKRSEHRNEYYLLTAMFFAIQFYYKKNSNMVVNGLIYPSAMTEKKGLNIVLTTDTVDDYLKLDKVGMYRFLLDSKTYNAYPCCDAVDIKNDDFSITGFIRIPESKSYTIECESKNNMPLLESKI